MAKPKPLVCQHLERVSRALLEEYQDLIRALAARRHGVYALYRGDLLYYVGLASDLRGRLKIHLRDRHGRSWDRFSIYLTIGDAHMRELESLVLRISLPRGNKHSGRLSRSENLLRRLRREVRDRHRLQEAEMFSGGAKRKKDRSARKAIRKRVRARTGLARHISRPLRMRARHKGKVYKARATGDGQVRFQRKLYGSPTAAAKVIVKRRCNGWTFWEIERAPGDWVRLSELRR